ncbi:MAG: AGE family epimerase/isomerase, partial [Bacillales bacterium]|nr:AGE family epimerase/isomerase [Bacillales bacterium]
MKKDKLKKLLIFGLNSINYDSGLVNWLNIDGSRNLTKGSETWITARMLHIYCLAKMANIEITNLDKVIETIENSLANKLFDKVNDGWFSKIDNCRASDRKESYQHAFVLLAYATYATTYNSLIAKEKLDHALKIFLNKFYDKEYGLFSDSFSNDWQNKDTYRGLNANMHAVEALLAVFDITNDYKILKIVERIIDFVIDLLKDNNFLLVEHFSENWQPLKDYNIENKADQFKPYGATIGHSFEWSRLFIQFVYTAKGLISSEKRTNILEKALKLFDKAEKVGWDKGYVYTVDFLGTPIIKERMHWVLCEALNASKAFYLITKEHKYFEIYKKDEK